MTETFVIKNRVRSLCPGRRLDADFFPALNEFVAASLVRVFGTREKRIGARHFDALFSEKLLAPEAITKLLHPSEKIIIRREGQSWLASYGDISARAPSNPIQNRCCKSMAKISDFGIIDARKALCDLNPLLWNVEFEIQ